MKVIKSASASALVGIWTLLLAIFVITALYLAREILIPLALASLLTFLFSSPVTWLERWIGRIAAVLTVVGTLFAVTGFAGWILTRQLVDLAYKLPDYQSHIERKLHAIQLPTGGGFGRFTRVLDDLKKEWSNIPPPTTTPADTKVNKTETVPQPVPVTIIESSRNGLPQLAERVFGVLLGPLGTAGLVLLLLVFMLLKREDLRGRVIRLIGEGRISVTTWAMDDAGSRVSRYLRMQLLVNTTYGICVALGLYFVGVPNSLLWGAIAGVLRFIPYVGPWIGAAIPLLLSLAVSDSWTTPVLTFSLFLILELVNGNIVEPWLYGTSTGVSSIALIIAAIFWTWLWGPVGLLLSTPFTVCLAVIGRHVPRLGFLNVLLSEEEALAPHEECYHRLLALGLNEASELVETNLKTHSLTELYDTVLIPVIVKAEADYQRDSLEEEQRVAVYQGLHDIIDELGTRPMPLHKSESNHGADKDVETPPPAVFAAKPLILLLPVRAERDELAGDMLAQLLLQQGFEVENVRSQLVTSELVQMTVQSKADAVCISVITPSTILHASHLCAKLRAKLPGLKIMVGIWSASEKVPEAVQRLSLAGANEIVVSLAEAVTQLNRMCQFKSESAPSISTPRDEMPISPKLIPEPI